MHLNKNFLIDSFLPSFPRISGSNFLEILKKSFHGEFAFSDTKQSASEIILIFRIKNFSRIDSDITKFSLFEKYAKHPGDHFRWPFKNVFFNHYFPELNLRSDNFEFIFYLFSIFENFKIMSNRIERAPQRHFSILYFLKTPCQVPEFVKIELKYQKVSRNHLYNFISFLESSRKSCNRNFSVKLQLLGAFERKFSTRDPF